MYQDNYFAVSVSTESCQRQTKCIDDQDRFQSVKNIGLVFGWFEGGLASL